MASDALISGILAAFALLQTPSPAAEKKITRQLRLRTRKNARSSVARLIREFDADPAADDARFRALMRGFSVLLHYDNAIETAAKQDPAEPPDPAHDEPDLNRLNPEDQEKFDKLWMKAQGILPTSEDE